MIVCDIGNTNIKFKQKNNIFILSYDEPMPKFDEKIYYISVNKRGEDILNKHFKNTQNLSHKITFHTKYNSIGIDRAVCCKYIKDGIVVDAGSAVTVDMMKNHSHIGGFILPGLKMYKNIYNNISTNLSKEINFDISLETLPLNTADAVSYGAMMATISPILTIANNQDIFVTGGDGKIVSKYIKNSFYSKDLILNNLEKIAKRFVC
ncbi:MAG: pantothenate kinase [Campylobacteraceae bacterium 4484_166]|nr:MAG: pantothenate kinase [Campylobacteraceae bacterium 4484_166]